MAFVYLTGTIAWAHHLFTPDEYNNQKKWKCDFYPDDASLKVFKESGSKLHRKINDDTGQQFIRPSSPVTKYFPKKDKTQEFKVRVTDADGNDWPIDIEGKPTPLIGNGSKATIKLEVYDTTFEGKNIKGTRLVAVRIDELVEYNEEGGSNAPLVADGVLPF